jgi:His Kinase A (phosphoacceptor) domain.
VTESSTESLSTANVANEAEEALDAGQPGNVVSRSVLRKVIARVQHQINNPLAALLAEIQLLSMEPTLGAGQREAVLRITELTRRVIALVHDLDTVLEVQEQMPSGEPVRQPTRPSGDTSGSVPNQGGAA